MNCSTNWVLSGLGPMRDISPRRTLKNWGSSSIEVFRIIFPIQVTLGSPFTVQPFFSSSTVCTRIERNLYIWKGRLCLPTLSCLKMMGPLESSRIKSATSSIRGPKRMMPTRAPKISISRFTKALKGSVKGTFRILMTGSPSKSSAMGLE